MITQVKLKFGLIHINPILGHKDPHENNNEGHFDPHEGKITLIWSFLFGPHDII